MQKNMEEDKNAAEDDNIWDDTLLIKAYDKSVKLTKSELAKRLAKETNKQQKQKTNAIASTAGITVTLEVDEQGGEQQQNENSLKNIKNPSTVENYKVGDYIRATYDDGVDYEAKILSINEDKQTCLLKYIGYGNEQEVNISDLVPSWGKKARRTQFNKSRQVSNGENSDDGDAGDNDMKTNCNKKSKMRRSHNLSDGGGSGNPHQHQFENTSILPPPPPPMPPMLNELNEDSENLSAMLMSWYMSGYYTGLYQGQKMAKSKVKSKR